LVVTIRCHSCSTDNSNTAQYCDECGAKLAVQVRRSLASASPDGIPAGLSDSELDLARGPRKTLGAGESGFPMRAGRTEQLEASSTGVGTPVRARLLVVRSGRVGHEFQLTGTQWSIGRWDPERGVFPDVDLGVDDPESSVSRRHARILYSNGQFLVEDLGSKNGTFINRGARLIPGRCYLVQDGDEVIVGKTFLRFVVG
jgi:hypothetical protein